MNKKYHILPVFNASKDSISDGAVLSSKKVSFEISMSDLEKQHKNNLKELLNNTNYFWLDLKTGNKYPAK